MLYLSEAFPRPTLKVIEVLFAQHHQCHIVGAIVLPVERQELTPRVNPLPKAKSRPTRRGREEGAGASG